LLFWLTGTIFDRSKYTRPGYPGRLVIRLPATGIAHEFMGS
jgi:hypothetical protein